MGLSSLVGKVVRFLVKNEDEIRGGVKVAKKVVKKVKGKKAPTLFSGPGLPPPPPKPPGGGNG